MIFGQGKEVSQILAIMERMDRQGENILATRLTAEKAEQMMLYWNRAVISYAEKLGISIKGEFGELALRSQHPAGLGERCTVFMESDLVHHIQQGVPLADLLMGVSQAVVENYIDRVAQGRGFHRSTRHLWPRLTPMRWWWT